MEVDHYAQDVDYLHCQDSNRFADPQCQNDYCCTDFG